MSQTQKDPAIEARDRAENYGVIWLNSLFTHKFGKINLGVRMPADEGFWTVFSFFIMWGLFYLLSIPFRVAPFLDWLTSPITSFLLAGTCAFLWGRNLAHISPLRRETGEGTSAWLFLQLRGARTRISSLLGISSAVYNMKETRFKGRVRRVEAIEWVGTRRARRAPRYDAANELLDPRTGQAYSPVYLRDRGRDFALRSQSYYEMENDSRNTNYRLKELEKARIISEWEDANGTTVTTRKKRRQVLREHRRVLRKQGFRVREQKVKA